MKLSKIGLILIIVYLLFWGMMYMEYRQCMNTPSFYWDNLFCDLPLQIATPLIFVLFSIIEWLGWTTPSGFLYVLIYATLLILHIVIINLLGNAIESINKRSSGVSFLGRFDISKQSKRNKRK